MPTSILISRFSDGNEFCARYLEDLPHGGLFQPTRKILEIGSEILLDVRMPALRDGMLLRGTVSWRQRGKRGTGQRAGLGIAFEEGETRKVEHLQALTRGDSTLASAQRKYRRLPVALVVRWRIPSETERHQSTLGDIGNGGAFIQTLETPAKNSPLVLELAASTVNSALNESASLLDVHSQVQSIEGRVAWASAQPGAEGFGIEFRCRDIGGMRRIKEVIRRIERSTVSQREPSA